MSHNEKLMKEMVKQPLGRSGILRGAGGGDGGGISKIPLRSKWKVGNMHLYNGNKLRSCRHCGKIYSHADDEYFELEINAHSIHMYWKIGKRK